MPNKKVTEFPVATTITPDDVLLVVQGGVTKQVSHDTVATAIAASTQIATTYLTLKQAAKEPDLLIVGAITRTTAGQVSSAAVAWPDGSPGIFTPTYDPTGAVLSYAITYGSPVTKTFTQPAITRDATGAPTNIPQIVVS